MKLALHQSKHFERFSYILKNGHMSHAYLFSGDFGSFELALWLAKSRFCEQLSDGLPCEVCRSCRLIEQREFSDVKIVEPQGQLIKTDTIRELTRDFSRSGFEGKSQVFIIKDADKMHSNAANSLLKFIEEPQSQSYVILLTSDESKVLPTIKSRCQLFRFVKNQQYLEDLLLQQGLLKSQARLLAQVATNESEALALSQNSKVLDLERMLEKFVKLLNQESDKAYLEVSRLSSLASEKDFQDLTFRLLTVILSEKNNPKLLTDCYQARRMWQANVSFQNALDYFVIA
ncbi:MULTISPECIES: DNA polymerase III subunit delta' [Streptococcus]|uniref:DNA polymerase III subunit delta n=1 Tax=Streptococcus caledonicus TaxID=2614158 RepID=A0ABW0UCX1_9STRE|nr:DNA polymerase III subunit delta' [Streptococcus sp. S784/96/1]